MAKRGRAGALSEQLDDAVEAMMTDRDAAAPDLDARVAELLRLAADLRDLPHADFRARLKADLQRRVGTTIRARAVPPGHHAATPCLVVRGAARAIEFYRQAFGATELMRLADANGKIVHAEVQIGDSPIALSDEFPEWGNNSPQSLGGPGVIMEVYFDDVDAVAERAVAAGATMVFPVADQFYGDRAGRLADPFGHIWIVATHKEDVTADEMRRRAEAWMHPEARSAPPVAAHAYRVEPYLPVRGADKLIGFLREAFDARETSRQTRPDGSIAHAEIEIGDSVLGAGDSEMAQPRAMPTAIHLYVPDADAVYQRALRAGASSMQEPTDQDYGDREGGVKDPFGNHWYIATRRGGSGQPTARPHIPAGLHSVTSYLHPRGASQLIEFLEQAFGAEEIFRAQAADGTVLHAKIRIGESVVEMGEAHGPYQPMPTVYHLYVDDTDAVYRRALDAGGRRLSEPANQPWGYRNAGVEDPSGNQWWINAPLRDTATAPPTPGAGLRAEAREAWPAPRSVTPFLLVHDVRKTVEFLKDAFAAELAFLDRGGEPAHDHAELRIGDSLLMMGEAVTGQAPTTSAFYLLVPNADLAYERALRAGARSQQPPQDMPWGHRMAHVQDPLGNSWFIAARERRDE
jgi:PhnB protein